jgi:hypothetical protein
MTLFLGGDAIRTACASVTHMAACGYGPASQIERARLCNFEVSHTLVLHAWAMLAK